MFDVQAIETAAHPVTPPVGQPAATGEGPPAPGHDALLRVARYLASLSYHVVYVYDMVRQRNVYANRELSELLGYTAAESRRLGAELIGSLIHPDDRARLRAHIACLAAIRDDETVEVAYRMRDASGAWRQLVSREMVAARDTAGAPLLILGVTRYVTGQEDAGDELSAIMDAYLAAQGSEDRRELAAPVLLLAGGVIVMPMAGILKTRRPGRCIQTLAGAVAGTRANIAILDIGGAAAIDRAGANLLQQAAQAVQLLGAQVVLAGLRPEVARGLADLGIDLSNVITRSTLQSGIDYALLRSHP